MFAHGERHDDADSGAGHPELEEIAALVDGRLPGPRAKRLRSHLASCAECREVFLETVDFVREEAAAAHPFDPPREMTPSIAPRPPAPRWLPAASWAAAAVVAVGIGLSVYRSAQAAPNVAASVATLAEHLANPASQKIIAGKVASTLRGSGDKNKASRNLSATLGSSLAALKISLAGQNHDEADAAVARINGVNEGFDLPEKSDPRAYFLSLRERLKIAKDLRPFIAETDKRVRSGYAVVADSLYVNLGRWAEAGKLAVLVKDERFLQLRDVRRFPSYFERQAGEGIEPEAVGALDTIEHILKKRRIEEADYKTLAEEYEKILRLYG